MLYPILRAILVAAMIMFLASTALATDPAVSKINGKTDVLFGSVDSNSLWAVGGSLSIPVTDATGAQFDVAFGELDSDLDISGYGLHLFARDPSIGLAGIVASMAELENIDLNRIAVEGEYYNGPLTVAALLGQQSGDIADDLFGGVDLRWYPLDELMVEIGASFVGSDSKLAHVGAEYQLLNSLASNTDLALSVYADLAVGEDSYDHALIGMRAYFGSPKELSKRHREDDPVNPIVNGILQSSSSIQVEPKKGGMTVIDPPSF